MLKSRRTPSGLALLSRRRRPRPVGLVLLVLISAGTAAAGTWHVPGDVSTIKAAVEDSAAYGDTVLVAPAVYDTSSGEAFPIVMGDGIVLTTEAGADATIIDAAGTARVFDCVDLGSATTIAGFTVTGGSQIEGGGLYCLNSDLEIRENIITGNVATGTTAHGGGICCNGGAPTIVDNEIAGNKARKNMGGGIFCEGGTTARIEGNHIAENVARYGGGIFMQYCGPTFRGNTVTRNRSLATGAGVDCSFNSYPVVARNVIVHNRAVSDGPGIACCYGTTPMITQNTIAGNIGTFGGGVRALGSSSPTILANIIVDNVDAIYLVEDSDSLYAHANNMYYNSYQSGDFEVINHTAYELDLTDNHWYYTDSLLIAGLIDGPADFMPFRGAAVDTAPGEPSAVSSVTVMEDSSYSAPLLDPVVFGDTLFIEVVGTDWNPMFTEPALVIITSTSDPVGVAAAMVETGPDTGIYRGMAYVDSMSDDPGDIIGVGGGDAITVRANVDPSAFYVVTAATAGIEGDDRDTRLCEGPRCWNHPDPFRAETRIVYTVPVAGHVTVEIYDVSGRLVRTLVKEPKTAGRYSLAWTGRDHRGVRLASGLYFCRIVAGGAGHTDKLLLLR
jgi:hypothetical protein